MTCEEWATWISAVGTMVGGVATAVGVIGAWVLANRWRHQARLTKRAEVAGDVIVATIRMVAALRFATALPVRYRTSEPPSDNGSVRPKVLEELQDRWKWIKDDIDAFERAAALAAAYLTDEVNVSIQKLGALQAETLRSQEMWLGAGRATEATEKLHEAGFGESTRASLQALQETILKQLKPFAQFAAPSSK